MHDTASFILHFHLFFGVTVFEKCIDLREHIEGNRVRINFCARRPIFGSSADLILQLGNCASAAARDCLITRGKNALDIENAMQRINRHQCDCGSAIRICDDPAMEVHIVAIDFWNDQRHLRLHSKGRRIIDHNRAGIAGDESKFSRDGRARTEKREINSSK